MLGEVNPLFKKHVHEGDNPTTYIPATKRREIYDYMGKVNYNKHLESKSTSWIDKANQLPALLSILRVRSVTNLMFYQARASQLSQQCRKLLAKLRKSELITVSESKASQIKRFRRSHWSILGGLRTRRTARETWTRALDRKRLNRVMLSPQKSENSTIRRSTASIFHSQSTPEPQAIHRQNLDLHRVEAASRMQWWVQLEHQMVSKSHLDRPTRPILVETL